MFRVTLQFKSVQKNLGLLLLSGAALTTISGCASVNNDVPTVQIVREAPKPTPTIQASHISKSYDKQAPLLCDNAEMRARVADDNPRNDKARLLITEDDGVSRKVIEDRKIDCKEYFAAKGLRFASHTTPASYTSLPTQRTLPAFVTTEPPAQTVTRLERPNYLSSQTTQIPSNTSTLSQGSLSQGSLSYPQESATTPIIAQPSAIAASSVSVISSQELGTSSSFGDFYEVRPGDNLYRIAKNSCTTVPILSHLNRITDPTKLDVGQILKLPSHSC